MSEKKGWGRTVMGWFVVDEGGSAPPKQGEEAVDDLIARYAGEPPPPPPAPLVEFATEPPKPQNGALDLPAIYTAAGLSEDVQGRISKAKDLLKALPAETPVAVKRQIVEASLKAFGYPVNDIIEAGVCEIEALEAYAQRETADADRTIADANARIELLNKEILDLRKLMQTALDEQATATYACNNSKLEIQQVLEFFGQEAVAKVVRDSPKLHEPK